MFAALLFMTPFFPFWHELKPFVHGIVVGIFFLVVSACLLVGNAAWFKLIGFRCPRCGRYFIRAFWIPVYSNRCKHCGLDLGPRAIDNMD
jgi:hypothetical protein